MKILMACLMTMTSTVAYADDEGSAEFQKQPAMTAEEHKAILDRVTEGCKDHFDIRPYLDVAMDKQDSQLVTPAVLATLEPFAETGHLALPADKANDLVAQKCVIFAEGLMAGGLGHQFVYVFMQVGTEVGEKIAKLLGDTIGKAIEAIAEAFAHPQSTEPNKK